VVETAQMLKRPLLVLAAAGVLAAVASSAALAAPGHGRFSGRASFAQGGFGPGGSFRARGFGGVLGGAFGTPPALGGGFGPGARGGVAGILGGDVLTQAASFLGVSVSTLAADLAGGKTLAQEATAKGKTATDLINAIVASETTVLDNEKAAGWITADQETSLVTALTAQITNLVNNGPPIPSTQKPGLLQTAATYLGISLSQLQSDLRSGKSLADEATANGKTADGLVSALAAQVKTNLDAQVAAGRITAAQEATLLTNITQRITNIVNNTKPASPAMATMQALFRR